MEGFLNCATALSIIEEHFPGEGKEILLAAVQNGIVRTRALRFKYYDTTEGLIPHDFWLESVKSIDWRTGTFNVTVRVTHNGSHIFSAAGVHFDDADLRALLPSTKEPIRASKEGRPPADWWDDLWVEMCRTIYEDRFVPKTLAQIEKAMSQWAINNNHSVAESTLRIRARKLFQMFESSHSEKSEAKKGK